MFTMSGTACTFSITGIASGQLSFNFSAYLWIVVLFLMLLSTVVPIILFWQGVKVIGPSNASIVAMVEPLTTVILARVFLKEIFTCSQTLGGVLILAGILVLGYSAHQSRSDGV